MVANPHFAQSIIDYFRNYLNLKIRQLAMVTAFDTTFKDTLIDFEKEIIKILKK